MSLLRGTCGGSGVIMTGNNETEERQPDDEEEGGSSCPPCTENQMLINQLKEITGIQDATFLCEALKASNNDLTQTINLLTEECTKNLNIQALDIKPTNALVKTATVVQGTNGLVVKVHDEDALQKALVYCLQQDKNNHLEEARDFNRSYNKYILENKNRSKRKRCEDWGDFSNPHDLKRTGDWPVGLKNVGNTCWFSAVIQSLFHLPEFRRLVHSFNVSQGMIERCQSLNEKINLAFMQGLQYLFAQMLGTNRKFVDPSSALDLLKDAFLSEEAQQQDVSEFSHKLLDWLEDVFRLQVNGEGLKDQSENPMVQLFYGTFVTENCGEDNRSCTTETFGQYPLQVNGYNNLIESLAGAMAEGEIEHSQNGKIVKPRQERWFTKLPPVLTFQLLRFQYNKTLGQPEKIHNKLEFPEIVYMDRFLLRNKKLIWKKREDLKKMNRENDLLHQKLERYLKYGSGANRCPLTEMLQNVLEYVSTKSAARSPAVDVTDISVLSADDSGSFDTQPQENGVVANGCSDHFNGAEATVCDKPPEKAYSTPSEQILLISDAPAPRTVTEEELLSVGDCLQRLRAEVEQDMQDLKNSIAHIKKSIKELYDDPSLSQVPYRLHAVLVHEGQANAGHYWAYIYSHTRKCWLKYNDISVTEATWEELVKDSYGGEGNTSAYCFMYINKKLPYLTEDHETGQLIDRVCRLPPSFAQSIIEENQRFDHYLEEWEEAQSCKITQMETVVPSQEFILSNGKYADLCCEDFPRSSSSEHATICKEQTALAINKVADSYEKNGAEAALEKPTNPEPEEASHPEPIPSNQTGEKEQQPSSQLSEVEIPTVGKILVRSDADGYNEETMLCPAMQGVILAILKARQVFDRDGPEAGLVKAFREEYSRLEQLSKELPSRSRDPRLQHVLIYLFQNNAPKPIIERTLLEHFADRNLSYDERSINIMKVARAKLKAIGPKDMDMTQYEMWHADYKLFRKVFVYFLTGLELYQKGKCQEAIGYLVHAHKENCELLSIGENRGIDEDLLELYRRKCLLEINAMASSMFASNDEDQVSEGYHLLIYLVIPCMHIMIKNNMSDEDSCAIEAIRQCWYSFLGHVIDADRHEKLTQFLPRLLDIFTIDDIVLKEPPKIRSPSPYDLCSRFTAIMESIHGASTVKVT